MRSALKVCAVPVLSLLLIAVLPGGTSAGSVSFRPARVQGPHPWCAGTLKAALFVNDVATNDHRLGSQAVVSVTFDHDPGLTRPSSPSSGSLGSGTSDDCGLTSTVTMRNVNTGQITTRTLSLQWGYPYNSSTLESPIAAGRVVASVSTNPVPSQLSVMVPPVRLCPPNQSCGTGN